MKAGTNARPLTMVVVLMLRHLSKSFVSSDAGWCKCEATNHGDSAYSEYFIKVVCVYFVSSFSHLLAYTMLHKYSILYVPV